MELTSVRDLKARLMAHENQPTEGFVRAFGVADAEGAFGAGRRRAGVSSRRSALVTARAYRPETARVSLGVTASDRKNQFRLGVRIRAKGEESERLAEYYAAQAGEEADVRVLPEVRRRSRTPAWFQGRRRPLEAGISVGHFDITAGTLGAIVEDDERYYVLSNNHVLANVNLALPGDPILQPGPIDRSPSPDGLIAVLDRFVTLSDRRDNEVDCAAAEILEDQLLYVGWNEALADPREGFDGDGLLTGTEPATVEDLGRPVAKAGRATAVRRGIITQVEIDALRVNMGTEDNPLDMTFSSQFEVVGDDDRPFSQGGDSGSLVVDEQGRARGLLFAGGRDTLGVDRTFVNPIDTVLSRLDVRLCLAGN